MRLGLLPSLPLLAAVLPLLAAAPLQAQLIEGRLLEDRSDAPVAGATIALLSGSGSTLRTVVTDAQGGFSFPLRSPGRHGLEARRLGFRAVRTEMMDIRWGDTIRVEIRIAVDAVPLAPLTVTSAPRQTLRETYLDDFYSRQRGSMGRFLGPEQIERLGGHALTTILRSVPGITVSQSGRSIFRQTLVVGRGMSACVPSLWVDGVRRPVDEDMSFDDWVSGGRIRAIEVYRSMAEVPPEFSSIQRCGAIVVWTDFIFRPSSD